ncbi:probable ATP-dependent RNA helicase DDX60 isoform X2 [Lytechinus variegatus]|nr:probable ATP-dependent RNA helicase DDX60 isoform X2 [Lytechinus variegatus]XP_041483941.1 probable ATP-dependent RNA helicase DDX60 isoform X2 [Lytechinus variegatus]
MAEGGLTQDLTGVAKDDGDTDDEFGDEEEDEDAPMTHDSSDGSDEEIDLSDLESSDDEGCENNEEEDEEDDESRDQGDAEKEGDAGKEVDEKKERDLKWLHSVYHLCKGLYIYAPRKNLNLMHDFTESDLFVIDGDSILADIFAQPGLDFSHGGQLLHLVYLVEFFLQDFQEREGQFHVIFFSEAETLWHSHPLELLTRRSIIQHLKHNTRCTVITHIPNPYSAEWSEYISRHHPAFVMLSDGESVATHRMRQFLIRSLMLSAVRKGVDCALSSNLSRSLRSIDTFYVEARKVRPRFKSPVFCKNYDIAIAYRLATQCLKRKNAEGYIDTALSMLCKQLLSSVEKNKGDQNLMSTSRDIIVVMACAEIIKGTSDKDHEGTDKTFLEGVAQAFLLHVVLLQYLPLEARAQNAPDDDLISPSATGLLKDFLQKMHYAMARLVASYGKLREELAELKGIKETESLADLIDGRLLYVILYQLQKYSENNIKVSFPPDVLAKFKYLWTITCSLVGSTKTDGTSLAGGLCSEDSILLTSPVNIFQSTSKELESDDNSSNNKKGLVAVSSQIITDYAGDLLKELQCKNEVNLQSVTARPRAFVENYHWHTGRPLKDHFETTREEKFGSSSISNEQILDAVNALSSCDLSEVFAVLGLTTMDINNASQRAWSDDYRNRNVLFAWRKKEGYNATAEALLDALEECQYIEAKNILLAKWSKPTQLTDFQKKRRDQERQKFARYMQSYGESVEGKAGLNQKMIIVDKGNSSGSKGGGGAHQGQKNKQNMTKKEKILQEKDQKDREKSESEAAERWSNILTNIKSEMKKEKFTSALKIINDFVSHCASDKWTIEALLAKMDCYWIALEALKTARNTTNIQSSTFSEVSEKDPMYYPIMLFICCQEILNLKEKLSKKHFHLLGAYMRGLGFTPFAEYIEGLKGTAESKAAAYKKPTKTVFGKKLPGQDECAIGMTCTRFQLQFVGQWMKRDERTDKDPRVPHFIPDTWQRELLDVVDRNASALIVAPTSSGKTYASYYCMEKVLRQSDDGIVVYVSPTKALMNQVSATVYASFKKNLPPGMHLSGVFSRDFRRNALTCQVLVTVPQCLEILLLSPCRQEWSKKIKYVIFDEVHCLGGEIGAEVWEHLLVTIKCPFLALSATIRSPEDIRGWLQASQDFKRLQAEEIQKQQQQGSKKKNKKQPGLKVDNKYKVELVVWKERHSDLEKYVYLPYPRKPDEVIMPKDHTLLDTSQFVAMHPVGVLSLKKLKTHGLPADLSLSPRETVILYDAMLEVYPECQQLKALDPDVYFQDIPVLEKQDARKYERKLLAEFMRWTKKQEDAEKVIGVIHKIRQPLIDNKSKWFKEWEKEKLWPKGGLHSDSAAYLHFDKLILQLNKQNKLPALVFSQDRTLCEDLAETVAISLENTETKLRGDFEKTEQWKAAQNAVTRLEKVARRSKDKESDETSEEGSRLKTHRRLCNQEEESDKSLVRSRTRRQLTGNSSGNQDAESFAACLKEANDSERRDLLAAKHFLLEHPLPNCTLQGEGNMTKEEVEETLSRLPRDRKSDFLRWLISRGIAYHHAGLGNKQRVAVETLFRRKHLKVLTATATLALGIHVPCKTVIFACEDLWLKPLLYRQMAGRSGRRGFDLVGNVIFYCVPPQKIRHLITSGLPNLRGHFPFSVSLVLRLMVLTHNSEDKRDAHEKVLSLLKHPFVCHKAADMEEVVKHFFLFSVDYLIHAGLLDMSGTPIGLSGLATHLHYHEPANLTFVTMLQEGAFHKLCKPNMDGSFSQSVMEKLVCVLGNMFGRITMPGSVVQRIKSEGVHSKVVFGESVVMPKEFSDILKKHNEDVLEVFRSYVHTVCDYAAKRDDGVKQNVLPLSKVAIQPPVLSPPSLSATGEEGKLITKLTASSNKGTTLSPFVMTSGSTDKDLEKFDADISQAIRQGVHIEQSKIPTLIPAEDLADKRGKKVYLNAYTYDFFKHGSKKLIQRENGLQSGETFDKLKDFVLVIASISVALEELGPHEDDVVLAFKQLKKEYNAKFRNQYDTSIF